MLVVAVIFSVLVTGILGKKPQITFKNLNKKIFIFFLYRFQLGSPLPKIVNGTDAAAGEFPYIVRKINQYSC